MKDLQVFDYENQTVRMIEQNGEPWFVLTDVCKVLELSNASKVAQRLDADERSNFKLGRQGVATIVNESGLYAVILRSDKPQAKKFRKWVTSDVLPKIRQTGQYSAGGGQPLLFRQREIETRELNARTRSARTILKLAEMTFNETYREALIANAANIALGRQLLPLPQLKSRTYTASEIGEQLGISANRVGRLANAHGLKTSEYGDWFADKAKSANKEVQTFRYYPSVVDRLREILEGGAA